MPTIQDRIKALRDSKGHTQSDLAKALNVSRVTVSKIETDHPLSSDLAQKISEVYNVNKEWLVAGIGETPQGIILSQGDSWREEAYTSLKELNETLKQENKNLWDMVTFLKNQISPPNFQKPLSKVRGRKGSRVVPMYPTGALLGGRAARA